MKKFEVLNELKEKKISVDKAYNLIYNHQDAKVKLRRAHFIKLKFDIKDERFANGVLKVLFFLPIPMFVVRFALRLGMKKGKRKIKGLENVPLSQEQIVELVSCKGILVDIDAHDDAKIFIKTI